MYFIIYYSEWYNTPDGWEEDKDKIVIVGYDNAINKLHNLMSCPSEYVDVVDIDMRHGKIAEDGEIIPDGDSIISMKYRRETNSWEKI